MPASLLRPALVILALAAAAGVPGVAAQAAGPDPEPPEPRPRAREVGFVVGLMEPGPGNAITDVEGVRVGHYTLHEGERFHTGITAVLPHGGDLFHEKVPAAAVVGNGFGKLVGSTQVNELGELETPVLLTGTLSVPRVADGLVTHLLARPGMEQVRSINPVVGETNDGYLSDIRARPLGAEEVGRALAAATGGAVARGTGAVGAGAGTVCFGFKGGIGTASRRLPEEDGGWTVGVLVQTNFGGPLRLPGLPERVDGVPLGEYLHQRAVWPQAEDGEAGAGDRDDEATAGPDGSLMVVVATDAPLGHRNLRRLAQRALYGMARTGGFGSNGSGDYAIAFSTHPERRIRRGAEPPVVPRPVLGNRATTPLFQAAAEATEEAIVDSLFTAVPVIGHRGTVPALPVDAVLELAGKHQE